MIVKEPDFMGSVLDLLEARLGLEQLPGHSPVFLLVQLGDAAAAVDKPLAARAPDRIKTLKGSLEGTAPTGRPLQAPLAHRLLYLIYQSHETERVLHSDSRAGAVLGR